MGSINNQQAISLQMPYKITVSNFEGLRFGDVVQIDWFGRPVTRYVGFSCGEHICWDGINNCIITLQTKETPSMT